MMKKINLTLTFFLIFGLTIQLMAQSKPVRLAVAGLTHGHAAFILGRPVQNDFQLVGIFETNQELAKKLSGQYHFDPHLLFQNLEHMLDSVKPQAVVAFGSVYDHLAVVQACAPRGIHVMVEKPLATTLEQAQQMFDLAKRYHIHLLTDYETSWYPTTEKSFQLVRDSSFVGPIRKVVFHDGHQGPKEIGCGKEFLDWLTDPVLNGGGAITDFGCYGANLMTALMQGEQPLSVMAVTRQYKPEIYPQVDDDATILVNYKNAQCIIQASWNWPFSRKDMEIYGEKGYVITINNNDMKIRNSFMKLERPVHITAKDIAVYEDPFSCFADVILGKLKLPPYNPYAPENNLMVLKILDAARESAKTGRLVIIK